MSRMSRPGFRTSRHARSRMQGRAIRAQALDLVLAYGSEKAAGQDRVRVELDHDTRLELEQECPELRGRLGIYAILAAETVVTVCHDSRHHRNRRTHRHHSS